ncbi:MAG: hypothetical protein QOK11_2996 [Pseudonocardiales bacterium]|nr:hypothetical protein [Pseudonocardiales bacterium]
MRLRSSLLLFVALLLPGSSGLHATSTAAGAPSATAAPFMPDGPPARAVVWAVGDGAGGPNAGSVGRLLVRGRPDVFIYLGDIYPHGTRQAFRTAYKPVFGGLARRTAPTPGNHDWPVHTTGYDPYWRGIHGRRTPEWYSFRAGGWRLIELNSETGHRSEQLAWLKTQLREAGDCRLAFWHRPRFSAGLHGDGPDMDPYWQALQGHASLVLSGHDHDMERFRARGTLTQLVAGSGGKSHYAVDRSHPGLAFANDRLYGALRIDLAPGSARLAFFATDGSLLDTTVVPCRTH